MNKLLQTLLASITARFIKIWSKLKIIVTPTFWRTKFYTKVRQGFSKLFDIKPRNQQDYYGIFRWLVSKRLAFASVVVLGVLCLWYVVAMTPVKSATTRINTYYYNAIPLKFKEGSVRILGEGGYLAYEGQVADMQCEGQGTLYNSLGQMVYQGTFSDSKFNGEGTAYFPQGAVSYMGTFVDNLYHGQGSQFISTGSIAYEGGFISGLRNGQGMLYNKAGNLIYTGTFLHDNIVYSEFIDKGTTEVGKMYTGSTAVYRTEDEYCVSMPEISAVYAIADGSNSLEEEWNLQSVTVISSEITLEGETLNNMNDITNTLGEPQYFGVSWVNLSEAVAMNLLSKQGHSELGTVGMESVSVFDDVYAVSRYNQEIQVYIYGYEHNGLIYTFYTGGAGRENFQMYAIELA